MIQVRRTAHIHHWGKCFNQALSVLVSYAAQVTRFGRGTSA